MTDPRSPWEPVDDATKPRQTGWTSPAETTQPRMTPIPPPPPPPPAPVAASPAQPPATGPAAGGPGSRRVWIVSGLVAALVIGCVAVVLALRGGGDHAKSKPPVADRSGYVNQPDPSNLPSASEVVNPTPTPTSVPTPSPTPTTVVGPQPITSIIVEANDEYHARYRMTLWARDDVTDCAAHAYGELVAYFDAHPCRSAIRYLWTMPFHGRTVALTAESVIAAASDNPSNDPYRWAEQFIQLENADGTGSINDLLREGQRAPGVTAIPAHEAFRVEAQDNGISVFDAWYVGGSTTDQDPDLVAMEESLFLTDAAAFTD